MRTGALLAAAALVLAVAAPLAGSPYASRRVEIDPSALGEAIARGEDQIDAVDLAGWIRDRKPGLRVIDVRPAAAFADFALPTAENIPIQAIGAAKFAPGDTVVLYADGEAQAAEAWVFLRARGIASVRFVRGGASQWLDEVINARLTADATPAQKQAFARTAELSRYFGGTPRTDAEPTAAPARAPAPAPRAPALGEQARRRGC